MNCLLIALLLFAPLAAHAGLEEVNAELSASGNPRLAPEQLESILRDVIASPATDLPYVAALALPFRASLQQELTPKWGTDERADVFQLFMLLELCDFNAKGEAELTPDVQATYARVWEESKTNNPALGDRAFSAQSFCRFAAAQVTWPDPGPVNATSLVAGSEFYVLTPAQVPEPGVSQPLLRAFRAMALAPLSGYEDKRHAHRMLVELMARQLQRTDAAGAAAGLQRTEPLYLLLCHAGLPISVFKPVVEPPSESGQRWCHFVGPYEEDAPSQFLFSHESNVYEALALQGLLGKAGFKDFDPLRHMVMVNFDAALDEQGNPITIASRRHGFMGYLDAFTKRRYPSVIRPWKPGEH